MSNSRLPERASLEYLRKLAKDRLRELRSADPRVKLATALLAVARDYGFKGAEMLTQITLPAIMPEVITALRLNRDAFPIRDGGTLVLVHPLTRAFAQVRQAHRRAEAESALDSQLRERL